MRIVVVGASGLVGSKLVAKLCRRGHEVLAASRASGVDTITGKGLVAALEGANVVVDVVNSPTFDAEPSLKFFLRSALNLRAAEAINAVRHHVLLSVVGSTRLSGSGYFRAKLAQEYLVRTSGIPYSILHSTQCFEFMTRIAQSVDHRHPIRVSPALVQPIGSDDLAAELADVTLAAPMNAAAEVAGPEKWRLDDLVRTALRANEDARCVTADIHAPYFGAELDDHSLTPSSYARIAPTRFETWLGSAAAWRNFA